MGIIKIPLQKSYRMSALWQSALVIAGALFAAVAVVGAIHGLFLIRLADREQRESIQLSGLHS